MSDDPSEAQQWLIWDGECRFCGNAVAWFERLDTARRFITVPAQACPSPPMTPERLEVARRAMIVITEDGKQLTGGDAVLYVLQGVGWKAPLMRILRKPPFIWAVNGGYRIVANNRQFFSRIFFPGQPGCRVSFPPSADEVRK